MVHRKDSNLTAWEQSEAERASERGPTDYGYGGGMLERLKSDRS